MQTSELDTATKVISSTPKTVNITKGFDLPQKELKVSITPRSQSPASGKITPVGNTIFDNVDDVKTQRITDSKFDPQKLYQKERGDGKEHLYMVVIGHVDAGKSTLMGHLLCDLGQASNNFFTI